MSATMNLRFQKMDKYGNAVFVVKPDENADAYRRLCTYHDKLERMEIGTFLPIYSTGDYATVRFRSRGLKLMLVEGSTYALKFKIHQNTVGGRRFCSCYIDKVVFVSKAAAEERGDVLDLEDEVEEAKEDEVEDEVEEAKEEAKE